MYETARQIRIYHTCLDCLSISIAPAIGPALSGVLIDFFGWRSLYAVYLYVMLEGLVFGFSVWWIGYLYVWAILVIVAMLLRKNDSAVIWAVVAAVYGLVFGLLMYLEYFAINGGWEMFFAMWVAGIPYDLAHCIGNFVFTLVLYRPLYRVLAYFLGPPKIT